MVDALEDIVDIVVNSSHSMEPFFYGRGEELIVLIKVIGVQIEAIKTPACGEYLSSGCWGIAGKFCEM